LLKKTQEVSSWLVVLDKTQATLDNTWINCSKSREEWEKASNLTGNFNPTRYQAALSSLSRKRRGNKSGIL
jgi:hypothetical protein